MAKHSRLFTLVLLASFLMFSCDNEKISNEDQDKEPRKIENYEETLKDGDTIPGEFIVTFESKVTKEQRDQFYERFVENLNKRDTINDTLIIMRVPCECGELIELYRQICPESHEQYSYTPGNDISQESWDQPSYSPSNDIEQEEYAPYQDRSCFGAESHESFSVSASETVEQEGLDSLVSYEPNRWIDKENKQLFNSWIEAVPPSQIVPGKKGKVIAISDSGLEPRLINQFAYEGKLWRNPCIDTCTGKGYNVGYSFYDNSQYIFDHSGHGTIVADILDMHLAKTKCNYEFMILKIFGPSGGSVFDGACSIIYAANHGADIINASWGSYYKSSALDQAMEHLSTTETRLVTSAGNRFEYQQEGDDRYHFPSDYVFKLPNHVVPVGGLNAGLSKLWSEGSIGSEGGSNYYKLERFCTEQGDYPVYDFEYTYYSNNLTTSPSTTTIVPIYKLKGTSFAAPVATAKIVATECCKKAKQYWDVSTHITTSTGNEVLPTCHSIMLPEISDLCKTLK